jgi:hypothetical protein
VKPTLRPGLALAVSAIMVGLALLWAVQTRDRQTWAEIQISSDEVSFGGVPEHETVERRVTVSNVGTDTLLIHSIKRSCTCASAKIDRLRVEPGSIATVTIAVRGDERPRSVAMVGIESNAHNSPLCIIKVRFHHDRRFAFVPGRIDFGRVEKSDLPQTTEITIRVNGDQHPTTLLLENASTFLDITLKRKSPMAFALTARVSSAAPCGELIDTVAIYEAGSNQREFIGVYAYIPSKYFERQPRLVVDVQKGQRANSSTDRILLEMRRKSGAHEPVHISAELSPSLASQLRVVCPERLAPDEDLAISFYRQVTIADDARDSLDGFVEIVAIGEREQERIRVPITLSRLDVLASPERGTVSDLTP